MKKILVLADKLSNIRALYRDILSVGDAVWDKFNQKNKDMHDWYYTSIAEALAELSEYPAFQDFVRLINMIFGKNGHEVKRHYEKVALRRNYRIVLAEELAESGNKDAMFEIAQRYYAKIGKGLSEEQRVLMLRYYEELAEGGNSDASLILGTMYYTGKGVEQSYQKAIYWYEKAAEKQDSYALCNLGYCYYYGRDVEIDYAKAYSHFSRSTYLENPNAAYKLGDMFYYGYHVTEDKSAAFFWYNEALRYAEEDDIEMPNTKYRLMLFVRAWCRASDYDRICVSVRCRARSFRASQRRRTIRGANSGKSQKRS